MSTLVTHLCRETPLSHSDRGWHTRCHTSGQRQTGSIWRASVHSCAGQATATAGHRLHEGSLYVQPPENNTDTEYRKTVNSFVNSLSSQLRSKMVLSQLLEYSLFSMVAVNGMFWHTYYDQNNFALLQTRAGWLDKYINYRILVKPIVVGFFFRQFLPFYFANLMIWWVRTAAQLHTHSAAHYIPTNAVN